MNNRNLKTMRMKGAWLDKLMMLLSIVGLVFILGLIDGQTEWSRKAGSILSFVVISYVMLKDYLIKKKVIK